MNGTCIRRVAALAVLFGTACSSDTDSPNPAPGTGGTGGLAPATGGSGSQAGGASNGGTGAGGLPSAGGGGSGGGVAASGGTAPAAGGNGNGGGGGGGAVSSGGSGPVAPPGACALTAERVRVTDVDVGTTVVSNEDEAALMPIMMSPLPSSAGGGSRLAFMGNDAKVHVVTLDANDAKTGDAVSFPAHDFSDVYADDKGGVLLLTRDARGGGTLNCGEPTNLCGTPPSPPVACYDMYMVRFDGASERWATRVTSSSAELPPYSTGKTGARVYMIWWYAHHGRIAFDGSRYAGYFGTAISLSEGGCINIHQGDRMKVVDGTGAIVNGGFDLGCSHSGYERIIWDAAASKFVTVCKTDNQNRIALAPNYKTIYPVDLAYSNMSDVVTAPGGGYWLATSNIRSGQSANAAGLADLHLLHFDTGAPDKDVIVAGDPAQNLRAPHLAAYGANRLVVAWESSTRTGDLTRNDTGRAFFVQTRDRVTGQPEGDPLKVSVRGNRYHSLVAHPDGSVAYAAPGANATSVKVLRVLPCGG